MESEFEKIEAVDVPLKVNAPDTGARDWGNTKDLKELEKFVEEALAKEVQAKGRPPGVLAIPQPSISSGLLAEVQKAIHPRAYNAPFKAHWGAATLSWHSLCCKKSAPEDFEAVCGCGWKIYQGDATVLPVAVQKSFSWVTKRRIWARLLCFGHALGHIFFINRYYR